MKRSKQSLACLANFWFVAKPDEWVTGFFRAQSISLVADVVDNSVAIPVNVNSRAPLI